MHPTTSRTAGAQPARDHRTSRLLRRLAAAVAVLPLLLGAAACGNDNNSQAPQPESTEPVELTVFWWGGEARAKATEEALKLYTKKKPHVTFKTTWQANQGYYDKLATLAAAGDAPCIFQIDDGALSEYADRGVTLDLTPYKNNGKLDVAKFPESLWKYGEINGKLAGAAFGENTPGMVYNKTLITNLGLTEPKIGMTWDELISWAEPIYAKSGNKTYGTMDPSADYKALWMWLRQQSKELYDGKKIGASEADLVRWFELWKGARDRKAAPDAPTIQVANGGDVTKQLVVTGKAATSFMWANQMPELASKTKDQLGVVSYPGNPSAQWARASMYLSVYKDCKKKDVAVDVINFLVNDPEAGKVIGTERGLPSNLDVRKAVQDSVTDANMKTSITFENEMASKFGQAPPVPPRGHVTVRAELIKAAEAVQFGRSTPAKAAADFLAAANAALNK